MERDLTSLGFNTPFEHPFLAAYLWAVAQNANRSESDVEDALIVLLAARESNLVAFIEALVAASSDFRISSEHPLVPVMAEFVSPDHADAKEPWRAAELVHEITEELAAKLTGEPRSHIERGYA